MSLFALSLILYVCLGALAGFLAGLFGIGGGIILVPGFYYSLSYLYPDASQLMQISIGTALATIIVTGSSSLKAHAKRGNVRIDIISKLAPGIVIGALFSALIADQMESASLKTFFALMILGLAIMMVIGPEKFKGAHKLPGRLWTGLSGGIIGCLSGLMGIGGATLSVPYMSYYKTPMREAVGTASAIGLLIAVPSALGFIITGLSEDTNLPYSLGYIYGPGWLAVILTSTFAAVAGARLAHHLDPTRLRRIFAAFMVVLACGMIADELF